MWWARRVFFITRGDKVIRAEISRYRGRPWKILAHSSKFHQRKLTLTLLSTYSNGTHHALLETNFGGSQQRRRVPRHEQPAAGRPHLEKRNSELFVGKCATCFIIYYFRPINECLVNCRRLIFVFMSSSDDFLTFSCENVISRRNAGFCNYFFNDDSWCQIILSYVWSDPWNYFNCRNYPQLTTKFDFIFEKARKQKLVKCGFMDQTATLPSDIEIPFWLERSISHELCFRQAPVKTNQEIYENSMLEDDPDTDKILKIEVEKPRWGPKHKGAQTLANFYSSGEFSCYTCSCSWLIINKHESQLFIRNFQSAKFVKVPIRNETL